MTQSTNTLWRTLEVRDVYDNPWIKLEEHQVINPAGKPGIYGKVCFKSQAVGIIPVDDEGNTWLVGQHRYTLDEWSWEIPMGGSPLSEDCRITAARELEEETGLVCESLQQLLHVHTSNSITDEQGFIFIAQGLSQGLQQLEDSEQDLKVIKCSLSEAIAMAQDGRITDAMSIAGLLHIALNTEKYNLESFLV